VAAAIRSSAISKVLFCYAKIPAIPKYGCVQEMPADPQLERARRRRMRHAERKLKEAQQRLMRTERSIHYWTRILADLRHERTRAIQHPLWPDEVDKSED
jgi:hypothetical protein